MSSRRDNPPSTDCKVYVGNLSEYGNRKELEDAFSFYGPLKNVWVARHPPGFAFVEFLNSDDAHDSVRGLNDTLICGCRVDVEHATGQKRRGNSYGGGGGGGGGSGGGRYPQRRSNNDDKCYECGERGHFARDCHLNRRNSKRSRSRSRDRYNSRSKRYQSRSASRSRSRSRSRSYHSPQRN